MRNFGVVMAAVALAAGSGTLSSAQADPAAAEMRSGVHDFDFEHGTWRVKHRTKPALAEQWALEFEGTCITRSLMNGAANIEEHTFNRPTGVNYGLALRAYDAKTRQWAIWWVDSRNPHLPLDPPMLGRFDNGVGTFYSDGEIDGKPARTRFIWSVLGPSAAHWQQALSFDSGKTWHTNWEMSFERTDLGASASGS